VSNHADLRVVLPTLNEENNISKIISDIRKYSLPVTVVDDGSSDRTVEYAQKNKATVLSRKDKSVHGIIASIIDASLNTEEKYILVMDADFQHPVNAIPLIKKQLFKHDLVICCRKNLDSLSIGRKILSGVANCLAALRLGKNFNDPMSGFFAVRTSITRKLKDKDIDGRGFKILLEILKQNKNINVGYIYYNFQKRESDESKMSFKQIYFLVKSLLT
jgi:dolichol-phosphate mannosyltransferase